MPLSLNRSSSCSHQLNVVLPAAAPVVEDQADLALEPFDKVVEPVVAALFALVGNTHKGLQASGLADNIADWVAVGTGYSGIDSLHTGPQHIDHMGPDHKDLAHLDIEHMDPVHQDIVRKGLVRKDLARFDNAHMDLGHMDFEA